MDQADEHMAAAQRLLAQVDRPELNTRMECALAQAAVAAGNGNFDAAVAVLESAIQTIKAAGKAHHPMYTTMLSQLATIHVQHHRLGAAMQAIQESLDTHQRYGRGDTNDYLIAQQNMAVTLSLAGETRESLARRELVERRVRELEPEGLEPLGYPLNRAQLLLRMARADAAKSALDGVLDRARQAQNPEMLTRLLLVTGGSYIELGEWTQADAVLAEATQLVTGGVVTMRAALEMRRAQLSLARSDLQSARQHIEASLSTDKADRTRSRALTLAAAIALQQGLATDAEKFASDALAITELVARGPDTSADVGEALLRLAQTKMALGATQDVRSMLERSVRCLTNGLHADHPLTREAQATMEKLPS